MNSFSLILVVLATAAYVTAHPQVDNARLHTDLLKDYHKEVIPDTVNVTFGMNVQCGRFCEHTKRFFTSVWERYIWIDTRLSWDPTLYAGIEAVNLCPDDVWLPDLRLYFSSSAKMERGHVRVMVKHTGEIKWIVPALYENFCDKNNDTVHCNYKMGSWVYSDEDLKLNLHALGISTTYYDEHCPWTAKVGTTEILTKKYPCCPENYSSLLFSVDYTWRD